MNGTEAYQKRGYLREKFRLFHLRDVGAEERPVTKKKK